MSKRNLTRSEAPSAAQGQPLPAAGRLNKSKPPGRRVEELISLSLELQSCL